MIAYVLPTRDRAETLGATLDALGGLSRHEAEVIVVDNASREPAVAPRTLANGLPVKLIRRERNEGAAGRNAGVEAADRSSEWIVMLDDDSRPVNTAFVGALRALPPDVLAVQAEIRLGGNGGGPRFAPERESGGLPEVFIGCGVAVRRRAFLEAGGYDPEFDFYAEEYDLSAKILSAGGRVVMDRRFEVVHDKVARGRDMDRILRRLVRNNAWVMERYAPESARRGEVARVIKRYGCIAVKEGAVIGYARGVLDVSRTISKQVRREMSSEIWDRFTGKAAARAGLGEAWAKRRFRTAVIAMPGKNRHIVCECLEELGVRIVARERDAEAVVIGTLSPGPMLDAMERLAGEGRLVAPWLIGEAGEAGRAKGTELAAA